MKNGKSFVGKVTDSVTVVKKTYFLSTYDIFQVAHYLVSDN